MKERKFGKWLIIILGILQVFISLAALSGGIGLVTDLSGKNLNWTTDILKDSPFDDFLFPGIFLLFVLGLGNLIGSIFTFRNHDLSGTMAVLLGVALTIWICVQVYWIGLTYFLQPLFLILGLVEFVLGFIIFRKLKKRS